MPNPYINIRTQQLPGLGRQTVLNTVLRKIQEGNHVSIVSPRYMGKSCFLRALAQQSTLRQRFQGIALCDVRHEPLPSNEAFFAYILSKLAADPLISADWKEFTKPDGSASAWSTLKDLGSGLAAEQKFMLVILDGLDQLAFNSGVDEAAWNNLNSLIDGGGIQFVTASCDSLDSICLDPQSRGSLFFQRFGESVAFPPVDEAELQEWLKVAPHGQQSFDAGARSELLVQTGGHPKLLNALLARLLEGASAIQVTTAADELIQSQSGDLLSIFKELTLELREALATLEEPGRTTSEARRALLARGLVRIGRADKLGQSCRMIAKLVEGSRPGESTLRELFGAEANFFPNATHALRLRLAFVAGNSQNQLFRHIIKIFDNLEAPDCALMLLRKVEDEAFHIIENLVGRPFPQLLVQNPPDRFRPADRAHNIRVVDCLTREDAGYSNAKLPRSIFVLLSSVHSAGNYANHPQGQSLSPGLAHALATTALELASEMKGSGLIH